MGSVSGFKKELPIKYCAYAVLAVPVPKIFAFSKASLLSYFNAKNLLMWIDNSAVPIDGAMGFCSVLALLPKAHLRVKSFLK